MNVAPASTYEATIEVGTTGLVGTIEVLLQDNVGAVTTASSTADIDELPAGSGIYVAIRTAPDDAGSYLLVWSTDGTYSPESVATEQLVVTSNAPGDAPTGDTYATVGELARILKVNATTYEDQLTEVLVASAGEINAEIDNDDLEPWQLALAAQVNLERAVELWHARPLGFNVIGLDTAMPMRLARDTWDPYAHKLAPLKQSWGIA